MRGLADHEIPAAAEDPHRLPFDQGLVRPRIVRVDLHQPVLGLRHDLLGDHEAVPVPQRHVGGEDQVGQVVARADVPDPGDGQDLEAVHPSPRS